MHGINAEAASNTESFATSNTPNLQPITKRLADAFEAASKQPLQEFRAKGFHAYSDILGRPRWIGKASQHQREKDSFFVGLAKITDPMKERSAEEAMHYQFLYVVPDKKEKPKSGGHGIGVVLEGIQESDTTSIREKKIYPVALEGLVMKKLYRNRYRSKLRSVPHKLKAQFLSLKDRLVIRADELRGLGSHAA